MRASKRTARGVFSRCLQVGIIAAFCLGAVSAFDRQAALDSPAHDAVEFSNWKKRIKRLKLADPESMETMLA